MKRLFLLISLCFLACNIYANNLKIGVVNLEEVVQKSPLGMSLNDKISKDFKPRQ